MRQTHRQQIVRLIRSDNHEKCRRAFAVHQQRNPGFLKEASDTI